MPSQIVLDEMFNVKFRVSEQALDFISDELDKYRCVISHVDDYDHAVVVHFGREMNGMPKVEGELRIDRIERNFEIVGTCEGLMLPVRGDWDMVTTYLRQLTCPQEGDSQNFFL